MAEELEGLSVSHTMDAISLLRPRWLRARGSTSVGVVIDGRMHQTRDDLAQIPIAIVERITFMTPADATARYGTGFFAGAIVVTTRRSR